MSNTPISPANIQNIERLVAKKCSVYGCSRPTVSKGLCDTHRKRVERHGHVFDTRPVDWGLKDRHPLYQSYRGFYRIVDGLCEEWRGDFRIFVKAVGERPSKLHTLARIDDLKPMGPGNWYWRESVATPEHKENRMLYMREYQRSRRATDPFHEFKISLKRHYGLTLELYLEMHDAQGGVCAVCKKAEVAVDPKTKRARRLAVDHCHDSGKVRGLLCQKCNTAIGALMDSPELLRAAADYVERTTPEKTA